MISHVLVYFIKQRRLLELFHFSEQAFIFLYLFLQLIFATLLLLVLIVARAFQSQISVFVGKKLFPKFVASGLSAPRQTIHRH